MSGEGGLPDTRRMSLNQLNSIDGRPRASAFPASLERPVVAGAVCWVLTAVFFAGQAVAQIASRAPYSLAHNEISDLGSTTCGPISVFGYHAYTCSPLHVVMNAAFIALGVLTMLGVAGTYRAWPRRRLTITGLALLSLAGVGAVVAGLAPENVNPGLHVIASVAGILGGQIAIVLLGLAVWRSRRWVGIFSIALGVVGLFGFFVAPSAGIATGTAERIAGYPFGVWMIGVGLFLLRSGSGLTTKED